MADEVFLINTDLAAAVELIDLLNDWATAIRVETKLFDSDGNHIGTVKYNTDGADAYVLYLP